MQEVKIALAPENPDDWWEVEALYDLCFAPGRTALSSYRLRQEGSEIADLCITARDPDGVLAGSSSGTLLLLLLQSKPPPGPPTLQPGPPILAVKVTCLVLS